MSDASDTASQAPRTTLWGILSFSRSKKSCDRHDYFITAEGCRFRSAKGKSSTGQGPAETRHKLPGVLSQRSCGDNSSIFPATTCSITLYCQPGKPTWVLVSRVLLVVHNWAESTCMADLSSSISPPPKVKLIQPGPGSPP